MRADDAADARALAEAFLAARARAETMYCQRCDLGDRDPGLPCGCRPTAAEDAALEIARRAMGWVES